MAQTIKVGDHIQYRALRDNGKVYTGVVERVYKTTIRVFGGVSIRPSQLLKVEGRS